jgi:hypothetical protein
MGDTAEDIAILGSAYGEELSEYFNKKTKKTIMETKKIKVEDVVFNREWTVPDTKNTIYYFDLKAEDDTIGQFSTNSKNQTKFLIGEEYEVSIGPKGKIDNFIDYTEAEKEKRKRPRTEVNKDKSAEYKYVRSRPEILSIISQSSYEAAMLLCAKVSNNTDKKVTSHTQIADISNVLCKYIVDRSGLGSVESKNGIKAELKKANDKSIVLQKSLKIAIMGLDLNSLMLPDGQTLLSTQGIVTLTELITDDINKIANNL